MLIGHAVFFVVKFPMAMQVVTWEFCQCFVW